MEKLIKCKQCGADRQEEHTYCPMCGKKLIFTKSDFFIEKRRTEDRFSENCLKTPEVPKSVLKLLSNACWAYTNWKFGKLYQYYEGDRRKEAPEGALAALTLVRAKAEELFSLILEF